MNIEEARSVLWLKNNPRPLGELLEEGFLTKDRLEWAAQRAYDPKLKQAAQTLLDVMKDPTTQVKKTKPIQESSADNSLPIGITLDKARATYWPFAPHKGQPMGMLVETRRITLRDLGFAIENAWDKQVKQAAIALSLVRLEQIVKEPAPPAGFINIISGGRSYANRRQSFLTLLEGFILGAFFTAMIMISGYFMIKSFKPNPNSKSLAEFVSSPAGILSLVIALGLIIFIVWLINFIPDQIAKQLEKQIEEYRRGEEGEDRTVQMIIQALDGNWSLYRNLQLPGRNKGDLDIILVGPPGVWVLEVKNYRGKYRNVGDRWEYRHGNNWKTAKANPSQQAFKNAVRLANFLKAENLKVFVNAVVVWANEDNHLTIENPSTAVWMYNRLSEELGNIWQGEKLSMAEQEKINHKLAKLCEK